MKKIICLLIITGVALGSKMSNKSSMNYFESNDLKIEPIKKNVFKHISYLQTNDFGKVACNGLVFFDKNEAIVYDTPTNDSVSSELINWIQKTQKKKIKAIIVTHFHEDCLGGLQTFHNNKIKSYASNLTIELAKKRNQAVLPENGFYEKLEITIGNKPTITEYFGEGHTIDNVVGYIPASKVLFGGCLIKSLNASKGNLEDANIDKWSETVKKIKEKWTDLELVIPGHGEHGNQDLLDYTIKLFDKK